MACLTPESIKAAVLNGCDMDDRTLKAFIANLLCEILAAVEASGGGSSPFAVLQTQTTVTAGALTSTAVAAQGSRRGGQLRNLSLTDSMNVNLGGAAVAAAPGLGYVPPGGEYTLPAFYTGTVQVIRSGSVDVTVEVLTW